MQASNPAALNGIERRAMQSTPRPLLLVTSSPQRSAFASVDTITAQLEIETGLRVRLRQRRVMLAGKFVMLMYTVRTVYTVLVLLGFSLKHAVPQDPHNVCRQASHARARLCFI